MASPPIDRMDKAQRRRLMATLLASAIADGQLQADAVDLAGLLFGDPDLWTDFQEHGAIIEDLIATSPSPGAPARDRLVGKARPTAMQLIEDDVVGALQIHDAQRRKGAGKSGDDTEFRRLRAKLKNYTRYLAERSDYQLLNRSLRDAYARPHMDQMAPADLAKEFSLPLADVSLCLDEVQALVSVISAPEGIDPHFLVPKTKKGTARRKLVLLDTTGRPRWGRRKAGGARPVVTEPARKTMTSYIVQAAPAGGMPAPTSTESNARLPTEADAAILQARLDLQLDAAQTAALPTDWKTTVLPVAHIIRLLPYPRLRRLDSALAAFGHPALQECIRAEPALIPILEEQAKDHRRLLLQRANEGPPLRRVRPSAIADRWWRAMRFYADCETLSAKAGADYVWPKPWEYISAARHDIYTDEGRLGVMELTATVRVLAALHKRETADWDSILDGLSRRGDLYARLAADADKTLNFDQCRVSLTCNWILSWQASPVEQLLPGFRDEMGAPCGSAP